MDSFKTYLDTIGEFGVVTVVDHPIITVEGLPSARPHEVVLFETGQIGEVFTVSPDSVEILLFSQDAIPTGTQVVRTGKLLSAPVGEELLGKSIDPLGNSLSSTNTFQKPKEERQLEVDPLGIDKRARIDKSLATGMSVVDMLIPLGKGQRELVIGDRKTGKSSFLLTTVKKQIQEGSLVVYAVIGKKKSDIKQLEEFFEKEGLSNSVIMVATSSFDSPSLIYLTPYTAMTIAEYFRDKGKDVLVVFDDLSTHAKFYREISLLAKNFPGRDSYPGDIFHAHARLLERAGNFKKDEGAVAISALPVVETVEGDLTGYIATNIMSMTDGHIFFDSNISAQGRRPAVNIPLSVTRVGKQIQSPAQRSINRDVMAFLNLHEKMLTLSHFGAELTDKIQSVLVTGEKVYGFFNQPEELILPPALQIVLFGMLWIDLINDKNLETARKNMLAKMQDEPVLAKIKEIAAGESFNDVLAHINTAKEELLGYAQIQQNQ